MLAQKEPMVEKLAETVYKHFLDDKDYYRMEALEETLRHESYVHQQLVELARLKNVEQDWEEAGKDLEFTEQKLEIARKAREVAELSFAVSMREHEALAAENERLLKLLQEKDS